MKSKFQKGFTLIELMTALSIFAVIMTISMGALLGVFNANRKSESLKTVIDNLNFSMEAMTREIRFGKNYHCGNTGSVLSPQSCSNGSNYIAFTTPDNQYIAYEYRSDLKLIEKSINGNTFIPITAPEVTITGPTTMFIVRGAEPSPTNSLQPNVFIRVSGYAGSKPSSKTTFDIQTMVTQRLRDI